MKIILIKINFLFFIFLNQTYAQGPILTLDEAINKALSQNFGIKIAQNDILISKNNAVKANAGFAPTIILTATELPSYGFLNQKLSSGTEVNRSNFSNNINAGVQLNWLLYDGKRMFLELDRLKELQALGEANLKVRTEQLIYDVMRAYFNIVRHQELFKSLEEQLNLFEERYRLAQTRLEVGKGNQLDVLQAQSDLSVQKTQLLRQKQNIYASKLQLNQLMFNNDNAIFEINDTLIITPNLDINGLKANALSQNTSIESLRRQLGIAILVEKQLRTLTKPRLTLNSAFNLGRQDNTAGLFLVNQNTGLNAGVTLNFPIYNGGNFKRQIDNAKIDIESNNLRIQELQSSLTNTLSIAYQNYLNAIEILKAEDENGRISKQSIAIAMERYRLSRSTVLELAQIQQTLENTIFRSISAKFDAKMAEIDLLRISGLLKQR